MLNEVADGVWVRQSEWVWSNATVVRSDDGLILVDPGIDGSDLNQLADDVVRLSLPVVAGFSTHPHWDHLLWHSRFGGVPRYATAPCAQLASEARDRAQKMAAESATGIPLDLIALLTPLPAADGGCTSQDAIRQNKRCTGERTQASIIPQRPQPHVESPQVNAAAALLNPTGNPIAGFPLPAAGPASGSSALSEAGLFAWDGWLWRAGSASDPGAIAARCPDGRS